jgi:uncharacterized cupredoxin-like copper-binding protein
MVHRFHILIGVAALVGSPVIAQVPAPEHVTIKLSSFAITPSQLRLEHGHSYVLDIENDSTSSHDFTAPALFAASTIAPEDSARLDKGRIELKGKQSAEIRLTINRAGDYQFHCSHPLHAAFGMKGVIHVV